METPLTPLEFGRRARKLYEHREVIIPSEIRINYKPFFSRCDSW